MTEPSRYGAAACCRRASCPFVLGLAPGLRLAVREIAAGIVIGPSVLSLVEMDESIEALSLTGPALMLFLT